MPGTLTHLHLLLSNRNFRWNVFLFYTDFHDRRINLKVYSNLIRDVRPNIIWNCLKS